VKLGAESTKKTLIAVALFVVAVLMVIRMISGSSSAPTEASTANAEPATLQPVRHTRPAGSRKGNRAADKSAGPVTPSLDPRLQLAALHDAEGTKYDGNGRNVFMDTEEPAIPQAIAPGIKQATKEATNTPPPPPKYTPPPIPLKFFGFASGPDHKRVFLAQGDDVFVATEGDIVQRRYKIMKINNTNIEVMDVLSNNRQTIPLTSG